MERKIGDFFADMRGIASVVKDSFPSISCINVQTAKDQCTGKMKILDPTVELTLLRSIR